MGLFRQVVGGIKRSHALSPVVQLYAATIGNRRKMPPTPKFWERRYAEGGNSGEGSYGRLAEFKAEVINEFVLEKGIASVIEFGCGDGNQLSLARYPSYLGIDVSNTALDICRRRFQDDRSKRFLLSGEYRGETADLSMSLDVIYHLVEDDVYFKYMNMLFGAGEKYVIIYSSNHVHPEETYSYVRHRKFSDWVALHAPGWRLDRHVPNRYPPKDGGPFESFADFYFYEKVAL